MAQMTPTLYTKENIEDLPWPSGYKNDARQKILIAFVKSGPQHFIKNVNTTMQVLLLGDKVLPVTICEAPNGSSYVCSPFTHYITYGKEEIKKTIANPLKRTFMNGFLAAFGKILNSCKIDKNIFVNNWLMPTNLHPEFSPEELKAITTTLISHFPDHAILFRSINSMHPVCLQENLNNAGYSMIMSRAIYFTDPTLDDPFKSRMFKSDLKIHTNSAYTVVTDPQKLQTEVKRIKDLYYLLNIQKYSQCNPQYTPEFIQLAHDTEWMTFKAFEKDGSIDGILGYFSNDAIMTSPFFGYDTSISSDVGLYRQISTQLLLDAQEKKMLLHQSGGAGHYKKLRRAKEYPESTAVYHQHLGLKRRVGWNILQKILNTFGKKFADENEI